MSDEGEKSSWLQPLPEEFASDGDMTGRRMLVAALTVIILAIFGGLIWYSYMEGSNNGPVPVVRADNSVVKEKPENPGGLDVPDQDKRVFNRVASDGVENDENLGPSAELPVERPAQKSLAQKSLAQKPPVVEEVAQDQSPPEETLPVAENTSEPPVLKPEDIAKEVAAIAPSVEGMKDGLLIQLGAFGKQEAAKNLWNKLYKGNKVLLEGLKPDIMMIDLGKKGVLYRLRGGLVASRPDADKICAALKAKQQACIVVAK